MEVLPTIDEVVDEIVAALESPDYDRKSGVDFGGELRVFWWPKWVEVIQEEKWIKVQREFGDFSEEDKELLRRWNRIVKNYLKGLNLPTLKKAVRASIFRVFELEGQGVTRYTENDIW